MSGFIRGIQGFNKGVLRFVVVFSGDVMIMYEDIGFYWGGGTLGFIKRILGGIGGVFGLSGEYYGCG
jgi:hypothetical protein